MAISAQGSSCWSSINPRQTFEVPVHDQKIGVFCAIIATQIDLYFFNHLNAEQ
jgi:hypothetical protein